MSLIGFVLLPLIRYVWASRMTKFWFWYATFPVKAKECRSLFTYSQLALTLYGFCSELSPAKIRFIFEF